MLRPVLSLRIPASSAAQLVQDGYRSVADFDAAQIPPTLPLHPNEPEARAVSAWHLAQQLRTRPHFSTTIPALDTLLDSRGLPLAAVTELVANPVGMLSNLCLRLCLAIQLPPTLKSAIYVDTTGSFSHRAARELCRQMPDPGSSSSDPAAMLDRIHVFRIYAAHELASFLASFDDIFARLPDIGLLLIDSVSWPFLASFPDNVLRRQTMHAEAAHLLSASATKHQVAASTGYHSASGSNRAIHNTSPNTQRANIKIHHVVLVSQAKSPAATHAMASAAPLQSMDGAVWRQISANSLTVRRTTATAYSDTDEYDFVLTSSAIHSI
ncbi:hypothetical protein H4R20_002899 [Coemansia guatemalensis]|uniref:DNA repair protein RAD51 homolog 3 n=1 Tax=Coemansia guatemalensis TaxID=2761395 RepID=A0A9W8I0M3_9FUNG|nr:hypothetical protein H4R20_002899 [Coemansia guatemalensis]